MCFTVLTYHACTVYTKYNMELSYSHIVYKLIVASLKESGVNANNRMLSAF